MAQRLEQLAQPGTVVVKGSVSESAPTRLPFTYESLGEQLLKGFEQPVRAFSVSLSPDAVLPEPEGGGISAGTFVEPEQDVDARPIRALSDKPTRPSTLARGLSQGRVQGVRHIGRLTRS